MFSMANDIAIMKENLTQSDQFGAIICKILSFNMTVIVGEIANFVAYIYAPAVLVTPLGALSIIVR